MDNDLTCAVLGVGCGSKLTEQERLEKRGKLLLDGLLLRPLVKGLTDRVASNDPAIVEAEREQNKAMIRAMRLRELTTPHREKN